MWEWITEHWEFVVGTAIGLLGIAVGIGVAVWQRRPKILDYELRTYTEVLRGSTRLVDDLKVSVGGTQMDDPHLVIVRVINTGKRAILQSDFEGGQPISIKFAQNGFSLYEVADSSEDISKDQWPEITKRVTTEGNADIYQFTPSLLNPGEWINMRVVLDGSPGKITASARFSDQSREMRRYDLRTFDAYSMRWTGVLMVGTILSGLFAIPIGYGLVFASDDLILNFLPLLLFISAGIASYGATFVAVNSLIASRNNRSFFENLSVTFKKMRSNGGHG